MSSINKLIGLDELAYFLSKLKALIPAAYAGSKTAGGAAELTAAIPFAVVDSTSTNTAYTVTVPGITELKSGACFICMNNKVTSKSGCTLNVNGLGAKPIYVTNAAASRVTTAFAVNYTWGFVFNESRITGGCWDMVHLHNTNTTYSAATTSKAGLMSAEDKVKLNNISHKLITLQLPASWAGTGPFTQVLTIDGATANSKIDLQPDAAVIAQLLSDGVQALYIVNDNGTCTAYAVGAAPSTAITVQATVTEVTT